MGEAVPTASRLRDWGLLVACNFIWGGQFVVAKLVQAEVGPVLATFVPMLAATAFLVPIVLGQRRSRPARPIPRGDWLAFAALGVLGQVAAQLLAIWGVRLTPASNAALLQLALPVVTAAMAFLLLGERMTRVRAGGFLLALAGVVQCAGIDFGALELGGTRALAGNLLVFGGVVGSAFYNVFGKRLLTRYTSLELLLGSYTAACLFLLPVALVAEPAGFAALAALSGRTWLGLGLLAGLQYLLSMVIFLGVLARLDATQAAVSNYLIPFFGVLLAAAVLGERLSAAMIVGGLFVLASTLLVTAFEERLGRRAALRRKEAA